MISVLFVGIGLSVFLGLTRSWFYFSSFSAAALCFDIAGIFLLCKIGWPGLAKRSAQQHSGSPVLSIALFVGWALFLGLYFFGANFAELLREGQRARVESSNPSCSSSLLRSLAKQPAALGSATLIQDSADRQACRVQWTRVVGGVRSRSCLQLESLSKREVYCVTYSQIRFELSSFESNGIHDGDMIVARTAFGHPSGFLYPSKTFGRLLFHPGGEIVKTNEDPEQKYYEHLGISFMLLLYYLVLGSIFVGRIVA